MMMFASDLDNTLLFSYRHKEDGDVCVEYLDGKEQGFFTQKSLSLLEQVRKQTVFVPVTTRSIEQYKRIRWPQSSLPKYAVTTNGAILLVDGEIDREWIEDSTRMVDPWREELHWLMEQLPQVAQIKRFRMIDDMYLFAACDNAKDAEESEAILRNKTNLEAAVSGRKIYFFPPSINKGAAVERLRERFEPQKIICAGDSVIDIPMLCRGDIAIVPNETLMPQGDEYILRIKPDTERFYEFVLNCVLQEA